MSLLPAAWTVHHQLRQPITIIGLSLDTAARILWWRTLLLVTLMTSWLRLTVSFQCLPVLYRVTGSKSRSHNRLSIMVLAILLSGWAQQQFPGRALLTVVLFYWMQHDIRVKWHQAFPGAPLSQCRIISLIWSLKFQDKILKKFVLNTAAGPPPAVFYIVTGFFYFKIILGIYVFIINDKSIIWPCIFV